LSRTTDAYCVVVPIAFVREIEQKILILPFDYLDWDIWRFTQSLQARDEQYRLWRLSSTIFSILEPQMILHLALCNLYHTKNFVLILGGEYSWEEFYNTLLRRIFGSNREKVRQGWRLRCSSIGASIMHPQIGHCSDGGERNTEGV